MNEIPQATDVPLIELLRHVPKEARNWFPPGPGEIGTRHIPFGLYCHRAADELEKAQEALEACQRQLQSFVDLHPGQATPEDHKAIAMAEQILGTP